MTFPDHKEALERLVVDRAGNVWVLALDAVNDPAGWRVFDRDGQQIATVDTHAGFEPRDIGDDWVLGVVRDDTGVPRVQQRSLQRNVEE